MQLVSLVNYEHFLLDHLDTIEQAVRYVARRQRLSDTEADDLSAAIRVKLIERDYEVLRKFQSRSTLRTYLIAIVLRHFLDQRDAQWGRWRPSMAAKRLGPEAVLLDRLLTRDGLSLNEAVEVLRTNHHVTWSRQEIDEVARKLPSRVKRQFVGEDVLNGMPASSGSADPPLPGEHPLDEANRVEAALLAALEVLTGEDVLILKYRFQDGLQIATIARLLGLDERPLYKRLAKLMDALQIEMEARGITRERAMRIVGDAAVDLRPLLEFAAARKRPSGPSHI